MSRIDKAIEMATKINQTKQKLPEVETKKNVSKPSVNEVIVPLNVNNPFLVTVNEPFGIVTEEFNKFRARILSLTNGDPLKNTLLVTSSVPNEGKSMTAINLAISIAQTTDYSVLLIDADLRRPSIHEFFDLPVGPGFVQCLRDNMPFEKVLVKTGLGKLSLLSAGQQVNDSLKLLSSKRMKEFVQEVKERYPNRYVIFDSPPVLPFADARVIGPLLDGTIFVTRENHSRLKQVKEGLESLHDSHVLGVLCNDTKFDVGHRYDSYYR